MQDLANSISALLDKYKRFGFVGRDFNQRDPQEATEGKRPMPKPNRESMADAAIEIADRTRPALEGRSPNKMDESLLEGLDLAGAEYDDEPRDEPMMIPRRGAKAARRGFREKNKAAGQEGLSDRQKRRIKYLKRRG